MHSPNLSKLFCDVLKLDIMLVLVICLAQLREPMK